MDFKMIDKEKLQKAVHQAKGKIDKLRKEDSLVFPIFTDLHTVDIEHEYTKRLLEALELITKEVTYDGVIDLGDNFSMLGRNIHIENSELKRRMEALFESVTRVINAPLLLVHGNHDGIGTDFFKADFWNASVKYKYGNTNAQYDTSGAYYYVDYEKANTRLVVMSAPYDSDLEAEYPTPLWVFGQAQLKWLKGIALNTEKDVILINHVPFYYHYRGDMTSMLGTWDGERARMSYISALCGWLEDVEEAVAIIKEYADRKKGRLVACLSGHMHEDSFWMPYEKKGENTNPLPCCQVVTGGACIPEQEHANYGISIDIAVWTPSENALELVRIGDGEDRKVYF